MPESALMRSPSARPSLQTGALSGSPEHHLALGIIDPVAREDGGDGGGGARDGSHAPVWSGIFGLQTGGILGSPSVRIAGCRDAGPAPSFPLRGLWKTSFAGDRHRGAAMRVKVLLQITGDGGIAGPVEEVAAFDKTTDRPEDLGLSIAERNAMLAGAQRRMVNAQAAAWSLRHRNCDACGGRPRSKGSYSVTFMTLYGDVQLSSPRLYRCACQNSDGAATVSPLRNLIPDHHIAPERLYLEARRRSGSTWRRAGRRSLRTRRRPGY